MKHAQPLHNLMAQPLWAVGQTAALLCASPSKATWASRGTGDYQASAPQSGMKEHQSALQFTSQIFERNLNFGRRHTILGLDTPSPLITVFLLICLCLDFGVFCHVGLFTLNIRFELLSSASWHPLDIDSAFLLHPISSKLWLLPIFPHHIDSLPQFS